LAILSSSADAFDAIRFQSYHEYAVVCQAGRFIDKNNEVEIEVAERKTF
jgi:hypothetical protein